MIYHCPNIPCDAYCGVHKGTDKSLGRLANKELRELKKQVHSQFDIIWREGLMSRTQAYKWLGRCMGLNKSLTHVGMFDCEQCERAIELCKGFLTANLLDNLK
jgi:hypothetical protein